MARIRVSFLVHLALTLLAAFCLLSPSRAQTPASLPRIAVMPDDADKQLASLADLLTASLSQTARGCELVERAELNRLSQEAEIQRMNAAERPRALARLAKADGLILLSLGKSDPKRRSIIARLSSTSTGLIHKTFMLATEDKDIPAVAKLAADALRFPAERLSKAGSPPPLVFSLLGIRATISTAPGVAIETTLNAAVTHHLSSIAGLAVVERWKLDDVAFERTLSDKDMPALATGTTLLDGSFEIKGKVATAKVRIRAAQNAPGKTVTVEGPSDDAFALARSIATKVAAECGNHAAPLPWDAKAEASAYAKMGEWMIDHKMGIEAAQAYESAVALGDGSPATLVKRIRAYALVSFPFKDPETINHPLDEAFEQSIRQEKEHFPAVLAAVTRAVAYCADLGSTNPKGTTRQSLFDIETATGLMASRVLVAAHSLKHHMERPAEVATLRQQAESLVKLIEKQQGQGPFGGNSQLDACVGFWAATPEQAADYWRGFLNPAERPDTVDFRRFTLYSGKFFDVKPSRILDWTTPDNSLGTAAWRGLIAELRASKSPLSQADGIALGYHSAAWDDTKLRARLSKEYIELMERNRAILPQPQGQLLFSSFDPFYGMSDPDPSLIERYATLVRTLFDGSGIIEARTLSNIWFHSHKYPKESVSQLLTAITDYSNKIKKEASPRKWPHATLSNISQFANEILEPYPELRETAPSKSAEGAVSIHYVDMPSIGGRHRWLGCNSMFRYEDHLVVPSIWSGEGFVSVGGDLAMDEVPAFPNGAGTGIAGEIFPVQGGFLKQGGGDDLWFYNWNAKNWTAIAGVPYSLLRQSISFLGDAVFVSQKSNDGPEQGHTIGRVKGGKYELIASSRRRPVEHPVDAMPPSEITAIFPGAHGRPYALLSHFSETGKPSFCEMHDLEQKQRIATLDYATRAITAGSHTLLWDHYMLARVDDHAEKPVVLFRIPRGTIKPADKLPRETVWDWPAGNNSLPHPFLFQDALFCLMSGSAPNGGMGFSLLCFQPGTRNPVEIPLDYQPTEQMKGYTLRKEPPALISPRISTRVIATPTGVFFGPNYSPGLLYVTWKEVNDWLVRHGSKPVDATGRATTASLTPPPMLVSAPSKPSAPPSVSSSKSPSTARKDVPFVNSLDMRFVPVAGAKVLFSVWSTRVRDFAAFVRDTGYVCDDGKKTYSLGKFEWELGNGCSWKQPGPGFEQTDYHPVVCVSWNDAQAFCKWLSKKEGRTYRLPTDREWSISVGIADKEDERGIPEELGKKLRGFYYWGTDFPPPPGTGNYAGTETRLSYWPNDLKVIKDYSDDYVRTSPVGSFKADAHGLYDMSGNVWHWCQDWLNPEKKFRILRGGAWMTASPEALSLCQRAGFEPDYRYSYMGFRCVIEVGGGR